MASDADVDLLRIDHVAIALPCIDAALGLFQELMGGTLHGGGDDMDLRVRTVQLTLPGGFKLELIQPTDPGSDLHAYLDRHGPGFHHMTGIVADLPVAIDRLEASGYATVGTNLDWVTWRETFIRPAGSSGALVQLVQTELDWAEPVHGITLQAILRGDVRWDVIHRCGVPPAVDGGWSKPDPRVRVRTIRS